MRAVYITEDQIRRAIDLINAEIYEGNICVSSEGFNRESANVLRFRLTVHDSREAGSRISVQWNNRGRRISAACWHAFGHFFEAIFSLKDINPKARIYAGSRKIIGPTKAEGNWLDWQIGAPIQPAMYSEACDCYGAGAVLDWRSLDREARCQPS